MQAWTPALRQDGYPSPIAVEDRLFAGMTKCAILSLPRKRESRKGNRGKHGGHGKKIKMDTRLRGYDNRNVRETKHAGALPANYTCASECVPFLANSRSL